MSIEEQFNAAVKVIRSLPKNGSFQPSDELKLTFYAYYKQATEGSNLSKKPPFYDIVNRYKWDAWKRLGDTPKKDAMSLYVEELKKVIETLSMNEEVSDFLDLLGPFYEFLPEEITNKNGHSHKSSQDRLVESLDDNVTTTTQTTHFNTYDSDGEEFTDTVDNSFSQKENIPVIFQNGNMENHVVANPPPKHINFKMLTDESLGQDGTTDDTQEEGHRTPTQHIDRASNHVAFSSNTGTGRVSNITTQHEQSLGFNEQLTVAIFRLQHSLDRVVDRIDVLESANKSKDDKEKRSARTSGVSKWLFPELSGRSTALVIAWPLIAYFVLNYVKQIRKK